jgi:5-methylcytosine-specific restriction protein A
VKLCTVCGVLTSGPGSRCTTHTRESNRSRHNDLYGTRSWQRLSARVLRSWRGEHGNWCPGYGRPAHRASDLTVDHVVPLAAGGAPFDIGNTAVLCRSCNSTKGASEPDRGYPHAGSALLEDVGRSSPRIALRVTRVTLVTVFCVLSRKTGSTSHGRRCGSSPTT